MAGRIHKFPELYWPQQYFMNTALLKLGMVHSEIRNKFNKEAENNLTS